MPIQTRLATHPCLWAPLAAALLAVPAPAQEALRFQYIDDRSTPARLIESYYNAINLGQYARAFGYSNRGPDPSPSYDAFKAGYADTKSVVLQMGPGVSDPGAGQNMWWVPVAIEAVSHDGTATVYAGCYTVSMPAEGMQVDVVPFQSFAIGSGHLAATDKPVGDAVPESCD